MGYDESRLHLSVPSLSDENCDCQYICLLGTGDCLMVSSDVGFLPIFFLPGRFPGRRRDGGGRRRRLWRRDQPSGMDRSSDGSEETQTVFEVPNFRIGKRIPFQRVCVQTETMGTSTQFKSDRAASEDLVSESEDEEQEEQSAASGAAAK